jgi:hypothetical protein
MLVAMRSHPPPPALPAAAGFVLPALALGRLGVFALELVWHGPITRADAQLSRWFQGSDGPHEHG